MRNEYKIIAETAFSHEGDFSYLLQQIDAAVEAKVDVIKFQVLLEKAAYCCETHPSFSSLEKWCFSKEQWLEAFAKAKSAGLDVLALPLTAPTVEFCRLRAEGMIDAYEVHSVCFNDVPILRALRGVDSPMVLGVGGRLPDEVNFAQKILKLPVEQFVLMVGFQSFPTAREDLNLNKIDSFASLFSSELGFADHCRFDDDSFHELNLIAYLKGCRWFEKHIVLNPGQKRTDFEAGVGVESFLEMRNHLDCGLRALGNGDLFFLNEKERNYKQREKRLVFSANLSQGHQLAESDIAVKVSSGTSDYRQLSYPDLVGRTLLRGVSKDETICYGDIG